MRIGLAQINPTVGDLEGNVARCLGAIAEARAGGADLVVLPEMAVPGSPPSDILNDPGFVDAVLQATEDLARRAGEGPPAVVGSLARAEGTGPAHHPRLLNAAVLLRDGKGEVVSAKCTLQSSDVSYEHRWFVAGCPPLPVKVGSERISICVGDDVFDTALRAKMRSASATAFVGLGAEPYRRGIASERLGRLPRGGTPLAWVNLCGGNDEIIYDGGSFALAGGGLSVARPPSAAEAHGVRGHPSHLLAHLAHCAEEVRVVDLDGSAPATLPESDPEEELFRALVLGIRDFARKNGVGRIFLGLSGGIDSAVVAVLASEALGPGNVTAVAVPSRHTDPRSTTSARELAEALGTGFEVRELEPLHAAAEASIGDLIGVGTGAENIQARLRAAALMAFVNARGGMLLNTSNKTELSLGYATLYGDSCGALSPLGDLTKPEVVALARWIRRTRGVIPEFTLARPPSAELAPDQVDPFDYAEVAPKMEALVRADRSDGALRRSEHKRRQMGVILRVSPRAFGTGRLIPIARR